MMKMRVDDEDDDDVDDDDDDKWWNIYVLGVNTIGGVPYNVIELVDKTALKIRLFRLI